MCLISVCCVHVTTGLFSTYSYRMSQAFPVLEKSTDFYFCCAQADLETIN